MTQEDKQILLKDLCARLPYGVKVSIEYSEDKYTHVYDLREIDNDATSELRQQVTVWNYGFYSSVISYPLINCRPYLRPMSEIANLITAKEYSSLGGIKLIDWYNANHIDYRGLIEKGLAIKVTEENNPYED